MDPSCPSLREETQGRDQSRSYERILLTGLLAPHDLFSLLSFTNQDHLSRDDPIHHRQSPSIPIIKQIRSHRFDHS